MKNINFSFFASVLSIALVLSSCAGLEKMKEATSMVKYNVTPSVLEMHGGQVEAVINGEFPAKYFNKNAILVVTPVLVYEGGELELEELLLQGEAVQDNYKPIPYEAGGNFTHNIKFEYKDDMKVSGLVLRLEARLKDKSLPFDDTKIADGIIVTPNLVKMDAKSLLMVDNFKRIIPDSKEADIHYIINRAEVRKSELKEDDIAKLAEFILNAKEQERLQFTKAKISAYASPDGPEDLNDKLSVKRQKSAKKYLTKELKGVEETELENFFEEKATAEDWDGFKSLMEKSEIQDKELILRVLSMHTDPVVREKEIKNISAAYLEIADDVLPELRRSKLIIDINQVGYSDKELKILATTNPDTLDIEELLYAAKLLENKDSIKNVYSVAVSKNPDCIRAHNNLGVANIDLGDIENAKASFDKAKEIKGSPIVLNNLGAIAILDGDLATAQDLLTKATDAGDYTNYNLGIIAIKEGKYEAAVNYLARSNTFNQALAMLLGGNSDAARKTLDQIENPDALTFYLKAVIGARMHDLNLTMNNLKKAIEKDESFKEYVKTDVEFARYFEDETFKTVIQ